MKLELVGGQYPSPLWPVPQSLGPPGRSYYLIRPPPSRNAGEDLSHLQDALVCSVAFDGLTVHPPHVGGPAVVVGVGQTTGLAVTLGYAWAVRDAGYEVVARLERLDADPVFPAQNSKRGYEALVDNPTLQISHGLWSRSEVGALQKPAHLGATQPGVLASRSTWVPYLPADARLSCGGEIHVFQALTTREQCGAKEEGRAYDHPPEPQNVGALFHPTML